MIHDKITTGAEDPAFAKLADLVEVAYHNKFSDRPEELRIAAQAVPDAVLLEGKIQVAYPRAGVFATDADKAPMGIVQYAREIGAKVVDGYEAEVINAPKRGYNAGNAMTDRDGAKRRVEAVVEAIAEVVAAAESRTTTAGISDGAKSRIGSSNPRPGRTDHEGIAKLTGGKTA